MKSNGGLPTSAAGASAYFWRAFVAGDTRLVVVAGVRCWKFDGCAWVDTVRAAEGVLGTSGFGAVGKSWFWWPFRLSAGYICAIIPVPLFVLVSYLYQLVN